MTLLVSFPRDKRDRSSPPHYSIKGCHDTNIRLSVIYLGRFVCNYDSELVVVVLWLNVVILCNIIKLVKFNMALQYTRYTGQILFSISPRQEVSVKSY